MSKLTAQALALSDAYRASGAPTSHPRLSYEKKARKAYRVRTEVKWHTARETGLRFFEYGDANLSTDHMPSDKAREVAHYLASCGFHAMVIDSGNGKARLHASTCWALRGQVSVYFLGDTERNFDVKVEIDQERHDAAWKRANER